MQRGGKQRRFLAARAAADLHDNAFAVIDILGQQQNFERIFQFFHIVTFFADLLLYHLLKVRVEGFAFEQGFCLSKMILRRCQGLIGLHHWLGFVVFLHQAAKQRGIRRGFGLVQADRKLLEPVADRFHLRKQF